MLHVRRFVFNILRENTYVVYDDTGVCAIIDPGCYEEYERRILRTFIEEKSLKVTHLVNTHAHIDHMAGNRYVKKTYNVHLSLHQSEVLTMQAAGRFAFTNGFLSYQPTGAEKLLTAGDTIPLGDDSFFVLHVPGHSPGHIALYSQKTGICFCGDVLFKNGIGKTDPLISNRKLLLQSIRQQLFTLADETVIYPGHGSPTTVGAEKRKNRDILLDV